MARTEKIRNHGAIPERRHDAFLLALLLALFLNAAFLAVQALLPRIAHLLQALGPEPALQQEESMPFILIDPDLLSEDVDPDNAVAESTASREATQRETVDLPEAQPYVEEGVDEILTQPDGSMGPELGSHDAPLLEGTEAQETENPPAEQQGETSAEENPPAEFEETPPPAEQTPLPEPAPEPVPTEEPPPEPEPVEEPPPQPEPVDAPPPDPEPVEEWTPPPPVEETPEPEPVAEPPPEPTEQPQADPESAEPPPEPLPPEPEPQPEPSVEMLDLASLPVTPDGVFDPQTLYLEELARQSQPVPPPQPQAYQPRDAYEEQVLPPPVQAFRTPEEQAVATPPRDRSNRRQPTFKQIGGASSPASTPSVSGGSPRQVNRQTGVNLLDSDPNMKVLEHRYGQYMRNVARALQQSLNREVLLNPSFYTRGQAKIYFSIAADGSVSYYETQYPAPGELDFVRVTSERTVVNAGPFDPPTQEMLNDPLFRRMSVIVTLY